MFTFISICFQFQKPGEKCLSLSLTLTSHLANVFFHASYVKSNRHEHVFLITAGDVLQSAVGFVAALRLSDNWAQEQPPICPTTLSKYLRCLQKESWGGGDVEVGGERGITKALSAETGNSWDRRNLKILPLAEGAHIKQLLWQHYSFLFKRNKVAICRRKIWAGGSFLAFLLC